MRIGVVFPQTEIGNDPAALRDYAQAVEGMGYTHILAYDHVLGASLEHRPDWKGPYSSDTPFHEVFVLLSFLAAVATSRTGHRRPDPAAAANCPGSQASGHS